MTIDDRLEMSRRVIINHNITEFKTTYDMSDILGNEEKLKNMVKTIIDFIPQMGFDTSDTIDALVEIVAPILDHPDNDDFSKESAVEDHINEDKNLEEFLGAIDESRDAGNTEFLLEVYRAWVRYKVEEKNDEEESK